VCNVGRTLDPTFSSDTATLICAPFGDEFALDVHLTAKPTAPIQPGNNTYDVQAGIVFTADTVNFLRNVFFGGDVLELLATSVTVAATVGSSAPNPTVFEAMPQPCEELLESNVPIEFVFPIGQGIWDLDEGTTQELTLEQVAGSVRFEFDELGLSTDCAWAGDPPKVVFDAP
jgi:hypothetical protein